MPNNIGGGGAQNNQTYYSNSDNYGNYQYIGLDDVISNFIAAYTGEGKILQTVLAGDVSFHAHRALQELNYDTLRSEKSLEIEVCSSLKVPLPNDYVNYVKFTWVDSSGIEHVIQPTRFTSNPFAVQQNPGSCTDCGDTADSYAFGEKGGLTQQEIVCDDEDIKCALEGVDLSDVSGYSDPSKGVGVLKQNLEGTTLTYAEKIDKWKALFSQIDAYCTCLANSKAEFNCGERDLGWESFLDHPTMQPGFPGLGPLGLMGNRGGWTRLRSLDLTYSINRDTAHKGTWPTVITTVPVSGPNSNTWDNYSNNGGGASADYAPDVTLMGKRYGLDPQFAQMNGSYYIDYANGMVHFGGSLSGKTVIIKYISDGVSGTSNAIVPKLAEEAIYKWIAYGCASARIDVPEGVVQRLKKERFAETRKAKIRMSNLKIEEIAQIMRGKSKFIDH